MKKNYALFLKLVLSACVIFFYKRLLKYNEITLRKATF